MQVTARIIPIDLLSKERRAVRQRRNVVENAEIKREARIFTRSHWQRRWESKTTGRWTAKIIPTISVWVDWQHGKINYHLTQFLTGRGCFNDYVCRIGKMEDAACPF
ncbi:hypothetical protein Trydic_g7930 [Trypoxylus dichotomus]